MKDYVDHLLPWAFDNLTRSFLADTRATAPLIFRRIGTCKVE